MFMKCYNWIEYKGGKIMVSNRLQYMYENFYVLQKVLLFLFILCLLTIAGQTSVYAEEEYTEIGLSNDGITCSLNSLSVEDRGEYIVGWVKMTNLIGDVAKPVDGKKPCYSLLLYAVNKKAKQIQILSVVMYDKNDSVISSYSDSFNPYNWQECIPNSNGEIIWRAITDAYLYYKDFSDNIDLTQ